MVTWEIVITLLSDDVVATTCMANHHGSWTTHTVVFDVTITLAHVTGADIFEALLRALTRTVTYTLLFCSSIVNYLSASNPSGPAQGPSP